MSYSKSRKINFSLPISVETALPLDYNSVFSSFDEASSAASKAVELGGYSSKNYIGQVITVSDSTGGIYKTYRIQPDHTLKEIAAEYLFSNGLYESIDSQGRSVVGITPTIYNRINITYAAMASNSSDWSSAFTTLRSASGWWQEASTAFSESSSNAKSVYDTVDSLSAKWNGAYRTVSEWSRHWSSSYNTVKESSGVWDSNCAFLRATSGIWNNTANALPSVSSESRSTYSTLNSLSSYWNAAYGMSERISSVTPDDVWLYENELADKNYVINQIRNQTGYFRGSFGTWTDVPETTAGYNSDITGSKTPSSNDYMVVRDDSARTMTVSVASRPVGETLAENVMSGTDVLFYAGHVITVTEYVDDIETMTVHGIQNVVVYRKGSWRFRYTGIWENGGKNNWAVEYRINDSVLTDAQIAALNSGITKTKTIQISKNAYDISLFSAASSKWNRAYTETEEMSAKNRSVYTTVNSTSGTWNTVSEKIGQDFFKYYSASAWSILTDDDTNFSFVPSGLIFIYEEDGTPSRIASSDMSIYTKDDNCLTLSKNITYDYDFGILFIGGAANFNSTTNTLTLPGSSDADSGSEFDAASGIFTFSSSVVWNSSTGTITLGPGDSYNNTAKTLTMYGHLKGADTRTMFSITNHLTNSYASNMATSIAKKEQFITTITPMEGYTLKSVSCTMGGVAVEKTGEAGFIIQSVTGDIVITAVSELIVISEVTVTNNLTNCTTNNTETSALMGSQYSATITPNSGYHILTKQCIMNNVAQEWIGNTVSIDYVTGNISISVVAELNDVSKTVYYTQPKLFKLSSSNTFSNGILTLEPSVSAENGTITFDGEVQIKPLSTFTISKNLTNVVIDNNRTEIQEEESYIAKLSLMEPDSYEFYDMSCTMGGIPQTISSSGDINIPSVSGNIVITATGVKKSLVEYNSSTNMLKLHSDARYLNNVLFLGRNTAYDSTTNTLTLTGNSYTNSSEYDSVSKVLSLGNNSIFTSNILTLGNNNTFDSNNVLTLGT